MSKKQQRIGFAFIGLIIWMVAAFVIDRYFLAWALPWLSKLLQLKLAFAFPFGELNLPSVGGFVLLGIPLIAYALYLIPWKHAKSRESWRSAYRSWARLVLWGLTVVLGVAVGAIFYLLIKGILPDAVCDLAESFVFSIVVQFWDFDFLKLDGSLESIVGLLVGLYLFLRNGLAELFFPDRS